MKRSFLVSWMLALGFLATLTVSAQKTAAEWFTAGNKLFTEKSYDQALEAYLKATELDNQHEKAFYKAGWCYNDLNEFDKAIVVLKKAVAINPKNAEAWQELGYAYKKNGSNSYAITALNKAIETRPSYALAYKQLGDVYQNMKNTDEALKAYEKCISIDPKNESALYNLGFMNNAKQDFTKALFWLHQANAIKKATTTYNEIGFAYYKLKMNDSSIAAYQSALSLTPNNGTAYKGMGDVYRRNYSPARVDDALKAYLKAVEYNPKSAGSHFGLGWCYNEKSEYATAIVWLEKSMALDRTLVPNYTELGYAYYMTKRYQQALETFANGIKLDNQNALCRYYSGLVHIQQVNKEKANQMYLELKSVDAKLADKLLVKINNM